MLADIVSFTASDNLILYGALYPSKSKSKNAILYLHGLGGAFYGATVESLARYANPKGISVFSIQQRGSYIIESFSYKGSSKTLTAGSAMEKFEDSEKDISGAIRFLKSMGYASIILAGKSTGCQKAIYYMHKSHDKSVKGVALLSPVDDRNFDIKNHGGIKRFEAHLRLAQKLARKDPEAMMPKDIMPPGQEIISASRFISTAARSMAEGRLLDYSLSRLKEFSEINVPVLAIFGSMDELMVMPVQKAIDILRRNCSSTFSSHIVQGAGHSLFTQNGFPSKTVVLWALKTIDTALPNLKRK